MARRHPLKQKLILLKLSGQDLVQRVLTGCCQWRSQGVQLLILFCFAFQSK
jgi:hypothetical protein